MNIDKANHFIHNHILKLLILMYGIALIFPRIGIDIKNTSLGKVSWTSTSEVNLSLPLIMLSFLLLNAGLSVKFSNLKKVLLVPVPLVVGLMAIISDTLPLYPSAVVYVWTEPRGTCPCSPVGAWWLPATFSRWVDMTARSWVRTITPHLARAQTRHTCGA